MLSAEILFIEDNKEMSNVVTAQLEKQGVEISVASDGLKGLELAEKNKPDLILLDILLPGISGFEVLKRLKKNPDISNIPVVMLSVLWEADQVAKALSLGAADFITKSNIPASAIFERIKKYLPQK
ncbi:MAG: hypothetical protein A3A80_03710 [Candidatus Terrybacteria bacterium RIFCSPLOWO2_01_FULL_44_24]|uniref:Response regulatory domain-containing protein n=1 Tax=Candidatus Terrybacteria bacterium RIFCSPHIGHO2_01_FULL_43_35 TaxID=1802361 RepID=A0A1G2PG32_9BACT|nr:MAG: hypothetical protein A2828_00040 [Candidatus Terrybacteria bacterium RIFCSPHIGHO2_01_FULL_43_35]OHA49299.1 MAG: hypothetical protein A3B75_02415 [Candidatus Terrybacteria bacterium RIFCSPHIGHO2_02_FULL_43_14]OHA51997.1 MAG: hypothetical protein A3A80_03710 [Candidatus Terrybacteria bacterium RIFCSPLOWO2_01_FULL_44_24]